MKSRCSRGTDGVRRQEGEARDDAAGLLPRVIVYRRTPQNLPASLLEELSRLVRYGSSGKRGKYEATRLRRREAMLSGSPRSSRLDVVLGSVSHDPLWLARLFPERRHSRIHRTHRVTASPRAAISLSWIRCQLPPTNRQTHFCASTGLQTTNALLLGGTRQNYEVENHRSAR